MPMFRLTPSARQERRAQGTRGADEEEKYLLGQDGEDKGSTIDLQITGRTRWCIKVTPGQLSVPKAHSTQTLGTGEDQQDGEEY